MSVGLMFPMFLKETVTVSDRIDVNEFGDPVYGDSREVKAKVENVVEKILTPEGNERESGHKIITEEKIKMDSRIWLPGEDVTDQNASRRPLTIRSNSTFDLRCTVFETWIQGSN